MPQEAPIKLCSYILSCLFYLISLICLIFGYNNNSWLVVKETHIENPADEFQRGLNDDCYHSIAEEFINCTQWDSLWQVELPHPYSSASRPNFSLYVSLYLARVLMLLSIFWFFMSILVCKPNIESWLKSKPRVFFPILAVELLSAVFLALILVTNALFVDILSHMPVEYTVTLGWGFYQFVVFGMIAFLIAAYFMYEDQRTAILNYILHFGRQPVPTHDDIPLGIRA